MVTVAVLGSQTSLASPPGWPDLGPIWKIPEIWPKMGFFWKTVFWPILTDFYQSPELERVIKASIRHLPISVRSLLYCIIGRLKGSPYAYHYRCIGWLDQFGTPHFWPLEGSPLKWPKPIFGHFGHFGILAKMGPMATGLLHANRHLSKDIYNL